MDTGDFTGDDTVPGRMQTEALIEGMGAMGYQVANLGRRELSHGYDAFVERARKARFELITANIVWQDTGEPIAAPTAVREVALRAGAKAKKIRVGFIGLSKNDPAFLKEGPGGRRIVTTDPLAAAAKHIPALRQKSDLVVALVAMDANQARALPKRAREIDLVLGGEGAVQTRTDDFPEDTKIGRARIFAVGDQGKNVGEVRLHFDAAKAIVAAPRNVIQLTRDWPDEPSLAALMEKTKVAVNEYHKTQAEASSPFVTATTKHLPLAPAPPAATPPLPAAAPPAPPVEARPAAFTGSERCRDCHAEAHGIWEKSGHAHAFDTLVRARQDFNPKCVGCHTVGSGQPGGFVNARATPRLIHVQCESCHGPSSLHPEPLLRGYGRTDTQACRTCHTAENSPEFDPAEYVPRVRHWLETGAAGR